MLLPEEYLVKKNNRLAASWHPGTALFPCPSLSRLRKSERDTNQGSAFPTSPACPVLVAVPVCSLSCEKGGTGSTPAACLAGRGGTQQVTSSLLASSVCWANGSEGAHHAAVAWGWAPQAPGAHGSGLKEVHEEVNFHRLALSSSVLPQLLSSGV